MTVSAAPGTGQVSSPSQPETTMEVVMTTTDAAAVAAATGTTATKPRLRRVACTCPNCKDGEAKQ